MPNLPEIFNQMKEIGISSSKEEISSFICKIEEVLLLVPEQEKLNPEIKHYHAYGVYGREIFLSKGTIATGKTHKHSNLNLLIEGEMSVLSIEGYARIKAPAIIVSPPEVKRLVFAHQDSRFINIHHTFETDLTEIEKQVIEPNSKVALCHG